MTHAMKNTMRQARDQLTQLLEEDGITAGMYVRTYGRHLIAGRKEPAARNGEVEDDDRVRFTQLSGRTYGLSVKRHTGRWEQTPFTGSLKDMVEAVRALMQHLVAPY